MALNRAQSPHGSESNVHERYVRFGIGGAGNTRKSCFLSSRLLRVSDSISEVELYRITGDSFRQLNVDVCGAELVREW